MRSRNRSGDSPPESGNSRHSLPCKRAVPILRALNLFALAIVAICSTVPYWPEPAYFLASLLTYAPLWIGCIILSLLLLATLAVHRNLATLPAFALAAWMIFPMQFAIHAPGRQRPGSLRMITANVGGGIDLPGFAAWAHSVDPDIILLQEAFNVNQGRLRELFAKNFVLVQQGHMAVLSRHEIIASEVRTRRVFDAWGNIALSATVAHPGKTFTIFNIHLETPRGGLQAVMQNPVRGLSALREVTTRQLKEAMLASNWAKEQGAGIVAGDFNLAPNHPLMRRAWRGYQNAFRNTGFGFGHTKFTRWHSLAIDHVLHSKDFKTVHAAIGPAFGGDHRPVIADLEILESSEG